MDDRFVTTADLEQVCQVLRKEIQELKSTLFNDTDRVLAVLASIDQRVKSLENHRK